MIITDYHNDILDVCDDWTESSEGFTYLYLETQNNHIIGLAHHQVVALRDHLTKLLETLEAEEKNVDPKHN